MLIWRQRFSLYVKGKLPEERARENIDRLLEKAGWKPQDYDDFNLGASLATATLQTDQKIAIHPNRARTERFDSQLQQENSHLPPTSKRDRSTRTLGTALN